MSARASRWMGLTALVAAAWMGLFPGVSAAGEVAGKSAASRGDVANGKALYEKKCAVCHGAQGRGDGPAEFVLFPKPRDLTKGTFKIRSTPTIPTDQDLFRTISQGMPGTSMPSWAPLTEQERWDLVAFVKSLSTAFDGAAAAKAVSIPKALPRSARLLAIGKQFYADAECLACHGEKGRGDGPSAPTLKDEWGSPIVPYDFTISGRMKGGSSAADIYRALTTGIGGTPMPSYADSLSEEQRWALAYYVLSLARAPRRQPVAQETGTLTARAVRDRLTDDPNARIWRQARLQAVSLRTLWLRPKTIDTVRVAALHNGEEIAFLLEWDDPVMSQSVLRVEDFRDAAAIQFPLQPAHLHAPGHPEPSYVMGEKVGPVNIWHWKADWQADLARFRDIQDRYPGMAVDAYPFAPEIEPGAPGHERVRVAGHDPTYLTGWGAGNLFSLPTRRSAVENLNAIGVGTITSQPAEAQVIRGRGVWAAGKWRVVMVRALKTGKERDAQLTPGQPIPIAFAVWDGDQG
ncbi:MAG: c-type cytochrome, partial [Deltaproteobacteria bacterium]|nr:c-type cytochrome [Deltaproteobacteria bacterium]